LGLKKAGLVAFCTVLLGSLLLAIYAGTAMAAYAGYSITVYGGADSVIDGMWTTNPEWDDAATAQISANAIFRLKYYFFSDGTNFFVYDEYLVEFFSDKTNDTGDYVSICYDVGANGGTAPQTDDIRVDYVGHNGTVITYKGTGSVWAVAALTTPPQVAELLSISKLNGTNPHWTAEFRIEKTTNGPGMDNAIRVAVYDASNPSTAASWPPTSINVPNDYGADPADTTNPIPEGIGLGVILVSSSAAVMVGYYCLRKRPRTALSSLKA